MVSKKGLITKSKKGPNRAKKQMGLNIVFLLKSPKRKILKKKTKGPTGPNPRHKKPKTD